MSRIRMQWRFPPVDLVDRWPKRLVTPDDIPDLGQLLWDAYRGTIDDGGETLAEAHGEIQATFEGKYGRFMDASSFVIAGDGILQAASLVTLFDGEPLLAFSITHPRSRRRGMARDLIQASAKALRAGGYPLLRLVVTDGNAPAQRLYSGLGFLPCP
jgi:ribosomal protein S18 acetylase RimI-like enzyme